MMKHEPLVLASASKIRCALLEQAGLLFDVQPANVDEDAIKTAFGKSGEDLPPADLARLLAQTKGVEVSENRPGKLIIGADQILVHNDKIMSKPESVAEARDQLISMRGQPHELISAVALIMNGTAIWTLEETVRLTMRPFSNEFLGTYLAHAGETVTETVGAYKLEGWGVNLFEKIEGDYFSVLGLPMLPLLKVLRQRNPNMN